LNQAEDTPVRENTQAAKPQTNKPQGDRNEARPASDRPQKRPGIQVKRNIFADAANRSSENRNEKNEHGNNNRNDNRQNRGPRDNRSGDRDNRFRKDNNSSAAPAEETRSVKDNTRSRDDGRNKKRNTDHDALGSKKQERFVNLEKNGGKKKTKNNQNKQPQRNEDEILNLVLPEHLTIKELADKMKVAPSAIVKKLFMKGTMVTVNQDIDYEQAEEIALEFNCVCEPEEKVDVIAELLKEEEEDPATMVSRPPVVCVMGHVDHGKTSLLDAIRDTHVIEREAGGITQKIGAYVVGINGQKITFLDTPGHEAFTAMRMRGANSTDIAILVVAADDGVMPQTVEAINHAKAAGVEIIVAINKIDKPNANIDRVKQELSEYELIPSDWGGSTEFVPVSAHTHEGIDDLLEMILLTSEVLELKANPKRNARGLVLEAELDKGRGVVATVLVQKGTLHVGDPVAAGTAYGKVRAMIDENGKRLKKAGPSTPVEILGLSEVPNAGEIFTAMDSEKEARSFAETFVSVGKDKLIEETKSKMSLDDLFSQIQAGNVKELNIIVKADVQGSVEAVKQSLVKLSNDEVVVKIIHGGVGAINESDVVLASASNAIIIGFNVRPDNVAKQTADHEGVDIRLYKVIYNAIEDVEAAMKGMLEPIYEEKVIGHAQVRQIFKSSDVGNIAGSYILDGSFKRDCKVRITREGEQIYEGALASLKRFKDDVKEVKAGYECGLVFDGFSEIREEDEVEAYIMVEVPR
jgi:translation initiation factor IF-2